MSMPMFMFSSTSLSISVRKMLNTNSSSFFRCLGSYPSLGTWSTVKLCSHMGVSGGVDGHDVPLAHSVSVAQSLSLTLSMSGMVTMDVAEEAEQQGVR